MTLHARIAAAPSKFRDAHSRYSAARAASHADPADVTRAATRDNLLDALISTRTTSLADLSEKLFIAMGEGRHGPEFVREIYLDLYQAPREEELLDELARAQISIEEELSTLTEIGSDDPDLAPVIAARTEQAARIDRLLCRGGALQL
jgi:hypothetical protein